MAREVYTNGAHKIVDTDKVRMGPINGEFLMLLSLKYNVCKAPK